MKPRQKKPSEGFSQFGFRPGNEENHALSHLLARIAHAGLVDAEVDDLETRSNLLERSEFTAGSAAGNLLTMWI